MWNREGKIWYSEEEYNTLKKELEALRKYSAEQDKSNEDEDWEAMNYQW